MKTFLICPIRGVSQEAAKKAVDKLERGGWSVHWPYRDTNQDDDTGLQICRENRRAIMEADVVHFIWDGSSQGCLFDLGMAFALGKRVIPVEMPKPTEGKSFQNMVSAMQRRGGVTFYPQLTLDRPDGSAKNEQ